MPTKKPKESENTGGSKNEDILVVFGLAICALLIWNTATCIKQHADYKALNSRQDWYSSSLGQIAYNTSSAESKIEAIRYCRTCGIAFRPNSCASRSDLEYGWCPLHREAEATRRKREMCE